MVEGHDSPSVENSKAPHCGVFHKWRPVPLLLLLCAAPAWAQSADDVAARVGTVARAMGAEVEEPWSLNATLTGAASRGNANTSSLHSTLIYISDSDRWRFGAYGSGAVETKNGLRANERMGLNVALAHQYGDDFRLVLIEEIVRAPLDGIAARNLLGGMGLWTAGSADRVATSLYLGSGWAHEQFTIDQPDTSYGAGLAGASLTLGLAETSTLNLVASYTGDLSSARNYSVGSSIALKAAINSLLGMQISYSLAYDNAPAPGTVQTNHAVNAGLTLGWKGQ